MERVSTIGAKRARLWHASLRLWMWRWQTLSLEDRTVFHKQQYLDIDRSFGPRHFDGSELLRRGCNIHDRSEWVKYEK